MKKVQIHPDLVEILQAANKVYDDCGMILSYAEEPDGNHGDTLARFVVMECQDVFDSGDGLAVNAAVVADAIENAAEQLLRVSESIRALYEAGED